ncbi:MAG: hypothetical protein K0S51_1716 [Bacillales bacterium]|nr:hypothetical protein [Bacillales bacterium]
MFQSLSFNLQDFLNTTYVVIPNNKYLYGTQINNFLSLDHRFYTGKKLYIILINNDLISVSKQFCNTCKHTGSRKDYEDYVGVKRILGNSELKRSIYVCITFEL